MLEPALAFGIGGLIHPARAARTKSFTVWDSSGRGSLRGSEISMATGNPERQRLKPTELNRPYVTAEAVTYKAALIASIVAARARQVSKDESVCPN